MDKVAILKLTGIGCGEVCPCRDLLAETLSLQQVEILTIIAIEAPEKRGRADWDETDELIASGMLSAWLSGDLAKFGRPPPLDHDLGHLIDEVRQFDPREHSLGPDDDPIGDVDSLMDELALDGGYGLDLFTWRRWQIGQGLRVR